MAQIQVIGYVETALQLKQSQKGTAYVSFYLKEHLGKGRCQTYQVWAWGNLAARMERLDVKEGNLLWLTGSLELVDCTVKHGQEKAKLLKIYCSDFGYIPRRRAERQDTDHGTAAPADPEASPEVLDGDRVQLPG